MTTEKPVPSLTTCAVCGEPGCSVHKPAPSTALVDVEAITRGIAAARPLTRSDFISRTLGRCDSAIRELAAEIERLTSNKPCQHDTCPNYVVKGERNCVRCIGWVKSRSPNPCPCALDNSEAVNQIRNALQRVEALLEKWVGKSALYVECAEDLREALKGGE